MDQKVLEEKKKKLQELIDTFAQNKERYKSSNYKEASARLDFIDKFFALLDWDVNNKQGYAEDYREVVVEDNVVIEGKPKAPDYSFRIGGQRKFFVEAKKPAVNVKVDRNPSYQVRRYGFTAKVPLSVLTDFEEFAIYDTRVKPSVDDKASNSRIFYCTFDEYIENFEYIYDIFAKPSILKGSFDKYVENDKRKRGTSEVDREFLKTIDDWRETLARNIALRNDGLSVHELNYVVQKIIDRIIFLRIAEDRKMEEYASLKKAVQEDGAYKSLDKVFVKADKKYNSGLFRQENFLKSLVVDDKVLKNIVEDTYYPKSPYEFSVLGVEILGHIYEQFLGKTIRLTKTGRAKVEEKPEVRKAGGVYYTPEYIVDYIVENTVGEKIKNVPPGKIEKMSFVDPACGSGSFLLGVFECIINRHLEWYTESEKRKKEAIKNRNIYQTDGGGWKLTIQEKKKILLNNIYGVDIDAQAVEVTKLSLYLKLMEGENEDTAGGFFKFSDAAILPSLDGNIKCGNSLIGGDFYEGNDQLFDIEEQRKINAFDREEEFSDVFENGGFDCVVGNPPYIKEYTNRKIFEDVKKSRLGKYYQGKMDFWYFFACLGLDILKKGGLQSFIAPNNWTTSSGASLMRDKVLNDSTIKKFVDFNDFKVFDGVGIQTMVYVLEKGSPKTSYLTKYTKITNKDISLHELKSLILGNRDFSSVNKNSYQWFKALIDTGVLEDGESFTFVSERIGKVLNSIKVNGKFGIKAHEAGQGIVSPQDFITDRHLKEIKNNDIEKGDGIFVLSDKEFSEINWTEKEKEIIKPYYTTSELERFYGKKNNKYWVLYIDKEARKNIGKYPNIKKHLDKFSSIITSDFAPYGLHRARQQKFFEGKKIMSLRKTPKPFMTFTDFPCYVSQTYYIIKTDRWNMKFLTGLLNSSLIYFWLYYKGKKQGDQLQVDKGPLMDIPLILPNLDNKSEKKKHDLVIKYVDKIIELKEKKKDAKLEKDKVMLEDSIKRLNTKIDEIVFDLYGLEGEERKILLDFVKS